MIRRFTLIVLLLTISVLFSDLIAQCPMCRMAAESNLEHGGSSGQGLNTGILYMLLMPYILVGSIGVIWYRNRKKINELDRLDLSE